MNLVSMAIFGTIGGFLGRQVAKRMSPEDPAHWPGIVGVILALLAGSAVMQIGNPQTPDAVLTALEREEPLYATLRQKYPDQYAQIRAIVSTNMKSGDSSSSRLQIRAILQPVILKRIPTSPTDSLIEFVRIGIDQGRHIALTQPELCPQWLKGGDVSTAITLPPDLSKRELEIYNMILAEPSISNPPVATDVELRGAIEAIFPALRERLKSTDLELDAAMQQQGPPRLQCEVAAEIFEELLKLPPTRREKVLRAILSA